MVGVIVEVVCAHSHEHPAAVVKFVLAVNVQDELAGALARSRSCSTQC